MISHDLNQQFRSPFVYLLIPPADYIRLLSDFDAYMKEDLSFIKEDGISYPVGMLKDVKSTFSIITQRMKPEKSGMSAKKESTRIICTSCLLTVMAAHIRI